MPAACDVDLHEAQARFGCSRGSIAAVAMPSNGTTAAGDAEVRPVRPRSPTEIQAMRRSASATELQASNQPSVLATAQPPRAG